MSWCRIHGTSKVEVSPATCGRQCLVTSRMRCVLALFVFLRLSCCDENPSLRGTLKLEQVLVFDAGSSGTRVHVFNMYPAEKGAHVPTIELSVRDQQTLKVKPGLSDFALRDDLDGTRKNIERLLEFASQHVSYERRKFTPVLLKATAGLRSVPAIQADAVLNQVRDTLKASGYLCKEEWVDIIRGKEEGGLAWVAANYLRGTFALPFEPSIGVIELGGGSTQVTFQVDSTEHVADSDAFIFKTLEGKEFRLYAHSYLGFGQDHAQAHMKARAEALFLSAGGDMKFKDPCYPSGFLRPVSSGAAGDTGTTAQYLHSSGDAKACQELIHSELFKPASDAPGSYAKELPLRGQLTATENFFYVRNEYGMPLLSTQTAMQEAAKFVCSLAEQNAERELERMKAGNASRPKACFALSYQAALLEALKVHTSVGVKLDIARQINGGDVDWALGAALMHSIANSPRTGDEQAQPEAKSVSAENTAAEKAVETLVEEGAEAETGAADNAAAEKAVLDKAEEAMAANGALDKAVAGKEAEEASAATSEAAAGEMRGHSEEEREADSSADEEHAVDGSQVGGLGLLVGALLVGLSVAAWCMRGGRNQFLKSLAGSRVMQATTLGAKTSPAE